MPAFSKESNEKLLQCDYRIIKLFDEVIKHYDCKVLVGHRTKEEQDAAVAAGRSKNPWPTSKHNSKPSRAIDVAPYPVIWPDLKERPKTYNKEMSRFYHFAGAVQGMAEMLGIKIRWGGDWDGDKDFIDQTFDDLVHFEVAE